MNIRNLLASFRLHEQITRLVCVEGWSAIAWWAGLRFDDLLRAYPPMSQARWARLESSVNLGPWGNFDLYFVSLDLSTARHPQILLATHLNGKPLTVEHGAPLRLVAPVKLGLKNIKANYADYLYEGRTAGLLGKARVFTLRRNLSAFSRTTCGVNNEQTGSYRCASLPALDNEYGLVVNDISFTDLL